MNRSFMLFILSLCLFLSAVMPSWAQAPVCSRLEAALAALESAMQGGDSSQKQSYEQAIRTQQRQLDRSIQQARRSGCDGVFIFSERPRECSALMMQIDQMRQNLERMYWEMERSGGGRRMDPVEYNLERRQILMAMGQNGCSGGAAPQAGPFPRGGGGGGLGEAFRNLFNGPDPYEGPLPQGEDSYSGEKYRTICVRSCDGFYFPISFSAKDFRFENDEVVCHATCPGQQVELYIHRNPGEDVEQAVSFTSGRPYSGLPNALLYRKEFKPECSCRPSGQSWKEALSGIREQLGKGDILVTEDNARKLIERKGSQDGKKDGAGKDETKQTQEGTTSDPAEAVPPYTPEPGKVRSVGPGYYSSSLAK